MGKKNSEGMSTRLQWLIEDRFGHRGMSACAREIDVPIGTLHNYLRGRHQPPIDFIDRLVAKLHINPAWYYHGDQAGKNEPYLPEAPDVDTEAGLVNMLSSAWEQNGKLKRQVEKLREEHLTGWAEEAGVENVVRVPIYGGAVAAGSPAYVSEEAEDYAWYYKGDVPHPTTTTAVRVAGESMEELIGDGGLVAVDHSIKDVKSILRAKLPLAVVRDPQTEGVLVRHVTRIDDLILFQPWNKAGDFTSVAWRLDDEDCPVVGMVVAIYRSCV